MNSKLPYLNVGCGYSFHQDWTNIDFVSTGPNVIAHNLLNGIPGPDNAFKVVYHSHVLEHFNKQDGRDFIRECYRVLQAGGILRVAVPDLEKIIHEYTRLLTELKSKKDDPYLRASYDWIMLEMYDQTLRNKSGGNMALFLEQDPLINEDFIIERCGYEVKAIIDRSRQYRNSPTTPSPSGREGLKALVKKNLTRAKGIPSKIKTSLKKKIMGDDFEYYYQIGKFRKSGEIHQWMYDEYSLGMLLKEAGFRNVRICTAFESAIPDWNGFGLETVDGNIRKPDSLFMEGTK